MARKRKGLTAETLAYKAGVHINTVYGLETGKAENVTVETLKKIGKAIGSKPGALIKIAGWG